MSPGTPAADIGFGDGGGSGTLARLDAWALLQHAALHHPDRLAIVDCGPSGRLFTYRELRSRSAGVARYFAQSGISRGDRVAVMLRNCHEVMEVHFAAAAIHAVVVNLNVHLAAAELAYILGDAGPSLVVAQEEFLGQLRDAMGMAAGRLPCRLVAWVTDGCAPEAWQLPQGCVRHGVYERDCVREGEGGDAAGRGHAGSGGMSSEDGFHMYYTSGTTGRPKGAVLSHRIVVTHAVGTVYEMKLNHLDIWGHFSPMFHLVDVFAVYAITLVGGRHVILPVYEAKEVLFTIERERVSATNLASTALTMLVNNPSVPQLDLSSLRVLSCGGSPQSPAVVKRAISVFGCEFFLSYGMTECCGKISMSILPPGRHRLSVEDQLDLVCSSGRPFLLMDVRVVGEDGADVTPGEGAVGEVWTRGPTVFDGYWNLEAPTSEAFEGGWFKTGDLGIVRRDGYVNIVDRKKDMILCGGENVYCTEVEAVLYQHPSVGQAAVFGVPNAVIGELVHAAVALRQGEAATDQELIQWCESRLAFYKVPSAVHMLESLPTTGSGKILKTELKDRFSKQGQPPRRVPKVEAYRSSKDVAQNLASLLRLPESVEWKAGIAENHADATTIVVIDPEVGVVEKVEAIAFDGVKFILAVVASAPPTQDLEKLESLAAAVQGAFSIVVINHLISQAPLLLKKAVYGCWDGMPCFCRVLYVQESARAAAPSGVSASSREKIQNLILSAVRETLGEEAGSRVSPDDPLMAAGVTSTGAIGLTSALERSLGIDLPGTLVFDYPTVRSMAEYVASCTQPTEDRGQSAPTGTAHLVELVKQHAIDIMGIQDIDPSAPLMASGMTSMAAVQLTSALEADLELELPGTFAFDYPTLDSMVQYLLETTTSGGAHSPGGEVGLGHVRPEHETKYAYIASFAQTLPGPGITTECGTVGDTVSVVPLERWDATADPLERQLPFGSFIRGATQFDAGGFQMSQAEAALVDPQQRLALEAFARAHADAVARGFAGQDMGVFLGVSQLEYARITLNQGVNVNAFYATGAHLSVTSGRISYTFGLKGPAVTVDTACSSSLVTTHLAGGAMARGDCGSAATLGVNLTLASTWTQACMRAGMLAEDGRCKTLDATGDGYVRAEAAGAAIMVCAADSMDGAPQGLICIAGTAINQDGRSSSLTAPNGPSQQEVIRSAAREAGVAAEGVGDLEMHGTGTSLGDPIEVGAALAALDGGSGARAAPLNLTALKSHVGHAEPAAGLVGLLALAAALRDRSFRHQLHLRDLNPYVGASVAGVGIRSTRGGVCMPRQVGPWGQAGSVADGGASSFAFMGTNAHAVLSASLLDEHARLKAGPAGGLWKGRCWVAPRPHPFLTGFCSGGGACAFECRMGRSRLAFLMDHVVMGRVLFPATAMLEFAIGAAHACIHGALATEMAAVVMGM
eukprot:evm.model.scf_983.1 EVM.evm.TU.scf_983.1   scf_983:18-7581(-)